MADDTLKLLQQAVKKRGGLQTAISPSAVDMCGIMDHFNRLHWEDRNRYGEEIRRLTAENKRLAERITRLEKDEA